MKSISKMLVDWDTAKVKDPKGWGDTYTDKLFLLTEQHALLTELATAGCRHIPGEPLDIPEMLAEREKLISHWV